MPGRILQALLAGAVTLAACGGPTVPSAAPPAGSGGFTGEAAVRGLVEEIVDTMQQQSYKRYAVDWTQLRAQVFAQSAGATRMVDAYPAVQLAFTMLGDPHSRYVSVTGTLISSFNLDCSAAVETLPALPANIGYIRVGATSGAAASTYAGVVQAAIRAADRDDTIGWIVDLRGNGGGSSYAMLAGVGPILGDGTAGYFINPDGVTTEWGYRSGGTGGTGAFSNGQVVVIPSTIHHLRKPNPRVAVLSDKGNASAGESTLIAFIGRSNTRTFGTPSCGVSTGVATLPTRRRPLRTRQRFPIRTIRTRRTT
jgi:C-terminal processing protease CtpA/Prc